MCSLETPISNYTDSHTDTYRRRDAQPDNQTSQPLSVRWTAANTLITRACITQFSLYTAKFYFQQYGFRSQYTQVHAHTDRQMHTHTSRQTPVWEAASDELIATNIKVWQRASVRL